MEDISQNEKKSVRQKLLGFQRMGLVSYGEYLAEQLEIASQSDSRNAYKKYIQNQIEMNNGKIAEINKELE